VTQAIAARFEFRIQNLQVKRIRLIKNCQFIYTASQIFVGRFAIPARILRDFHKSKFSWHGSAPNKILQKTSKTAIASDFAKRNVSSCTNCAAPACEPAALD